MPTSQSTLEYILDQLSFLPNVTTRKMFGEYSLYNHGNYFAMVCDSKLFFKTTANLVNLIGDDGLRAYEGSKNSLHIPDVIIEDKDKLKEITNQYLLG